MGRLGRLLFSRREISHIFYFSYPYLPGPAEISLSLPVAVPISFYLITLTVRAPHQLPSMHNVPPVSYG